MAWASIAPQFRRIQEHPTFELAQRMRSSRTPPQGIHDPKSLNAAALDAVKASTTGVILRP